MGRTGFSARGFASRRKTAHSFHSVRPCPLDSSVIINVRRRRRRSASCCETFRDVSEDVPLILGIVETWGLLRHQTRQKRQISVMAVARWKPRGKMFRSSAKSGLHQSREGGDRGLHCGFHAKSLAGKVFIKSNAAEKFDDLKLFTKRRSRTFLRTEFRKR